MSKYCPIIKDNCKAEICIAWRNNECFFMNFLEQIYKSKILFNERIEGMRNQILEDEAKAQNLLPECLEWIKKNEITRLTREDIKTFLVIKNVVLCKEAIRFLWRQAKANLKEWKKEISLNWRDNASNKGLTWSLDEDEALIEEFDSDKDIKELAMIHKRSTRAIELRLEKLGKIQLPK